VAALVRAAGSVTEDDSTRSAVEITPLSPPIIDRAISAAIARMSCEQSVNE
jgi:hypothetical protein